MEMVERLERKGLGTVAETAPSQVSAGRKGAGQTIENRWVILVFHDCGPHLRAAASIAHDGQRSGE